LDVSAAETTECERHEHNERSDKPPRQGGHEPCTLWRERVKDYSRCRGAERERIRNSPTPNVCEARGATDGERANGTNRHTSSRDRCVRHPDVVNLCAPIPKGGVHLRAN